MSDDRWENFAREDAEYYVLTDIGRGADDDALQEFFATGEGEAARIMTRCDAHLGEHNLAIEIGCGVGRVAVPMSKRFKRIVGVDVAPTMLAKLRDNAERAGAAVETKLVHEAWDEPDRADLVYSVLVFQHIPSLDTIASYLHRTARSLKLRGVGYLQFDTRPRTVPYRLRNTLPDAVLPGQWRRGLRRIRRDSEVVRRLLRDAGLAIVDEATPDSDAHVFVVRRA